jgi:hypothetical protein
MFISAPLIQILIDDAEQAPPEGALVIHPVGGLAERVGVERKPVRPALDHARHDAGFLQHLQVLGDRRLGHPEAGAGVAHGRRTCGEALDDAAADRVRKRLERIVNHRVNSITNANGLSHWAPAGVSSVAGSPPAMR